MMNFENHVVGTANELPEDFKTTELIRVDDISYQIEFELKDKTAMVDFFAADDEERHGGVTNAGLKQANRLMFKIADFLKEKISHYDIEKIVISPAGDTEDFEIDIGKTLRLENYISNNIDKLGEILEGYSWRDPRLSYVIHDKMIKTKDLLNGESWELDFGNVFDLSSHRTVEDEKDKYLNTAVEAIEMIIKNTPDDFWKEYGGKPSLENFASKIQAKKGEGRREKRHLLYSNFLKKNFPEYFVEDIRGVLIVHINKQ